MLPFSMLFVGVAFLMVPTTSVEASFSDTLDSEVVYVLEPFESLLFEEDGGSTAITMTPANDNSTLNLGLSSSSNIENDAYIGDHSLRMTFDVSDDTTIASSRWILQDRPHNCYGADYVSFWYRSLQPGVRLRTQLFDDSECIESATTTNCAEVNNLNRYGIFDDELMGDGQWHEVQTMIESIDGGLQMARIRGFSMILLEGSGTLYIDQFACIGGGSMLSSAFHIDPTLTLDDAISESTWMDFYYNSNKSRDETVASLQGGKLSLDYTIVQKESWGGFLDFSHLAPGNAYYNLTQATDVSLNYFVKAANSIPGRAIFRFILLDGSNCTKDCDTDYHQVERWYSFNAVLDEPGQGQVSIPLVGSEEPSAPFWLPGWAGILGDRKLSLEEIKGFTIELNLDSVLEIDDFVTGSVEFFDFKAVQINRDDDDEQEDSDYEKQCVEETDLDFTITDYSSFKKLEFLSGQCCEVCEEDPECIYALIVGRDCFMASYVEAEYVGLIKSEAAREDRIVMWMDDVSKRGDFCDRCICEPNNDIIDCRGQDLVVIPKTFKESWVPRILDLRDNPRLTVLGSGSLDAISDSLERLVLPSTMKHVASKALLGLAQLSSVEFESSEEESNYSLGNVIANPSDFFDDICCSKGSILDLASKSSDTSSLAFCNLVLHRPGIDSVYEPFLHYERGTELDVITPSSDFMSEAAESAEKCAEYCSINDECRFFGYDARIVNAEHLCYHFSDTATDGIQVCCSDLHYADEQKQIPGWTSGKPPATRHELNNARVTYSSNSVGVTTKNNFQATYEVSLGSTPLRGAVWVEAELITESTGLDVTILPSRVVLYDENQIATVTITVHGVTPDYPTATLIVRNRLESCDEAFTVTGMSDDNLIYISVEIPESQDKRRWGLIIGLPVAVLFLLGVGVFLFYENKRKENDLVWQVDKRDLVFANPVSLDYPGCAFFSLRLSKLTNTPVVCLIFSLISLEGGHSGWSFWHIIAERRLQ